MQTEAKENKGHGNGDDATTLFVCVCHVCAETLLRVVNISRRSPLTTGAKELDVMRSSGFQGDQSLNEAPLHVIREIFLCMPKREHIARTILSSPVKT